MLNLTVMPLSLAIARLPSSSPIPSWLANEEGFFSLTRTQDELSVVCTENRVPSNVKVEKGWRCIKIEGPLDFGLTGVLSSLLNPLAEAKISIFAISTFDTDYLMIKKEHIQKAIEILNTFCNIREK